MGLMDIFFGENLKLPFSKILRFERIESEFNLKIGDKPKLWNKPDTNQINLYSKGTIGGNGLVGIAYNSTISHHLRNTKYLFIETEIIELKRNHIDLFVKIFEDKEAVIKQQEDNKAHWMATVQKKYKPKSTWELRFFSKSLMTKNNLKVNIILKEELNNYYDKKSELIWLTDNQGNIIDAENAIREGGVEKTLRAVFSGHEIVIKELKKEHCWYYLEIGIKD